MCCALGVGGRRVAAETAALRVAGKGRERTWFWRGIGGFWPRCSAPPKAGSTPAGRDLPPQSRELAVVRWWMVSSVGVVVRLMPAKSRRSDGGMVARVLWVGCGWTAGRGRDGRTPGRVRRTRALPPGTATGWLAHWRMPEKSRLMKDTTRHWQGVLCCCARGRARSGELKGRSAAAGCPSQQPGENRRLVRENPIVFRDF